MLSSVSYRMNLIRNLYNAAVSHFADCKNPECNVSIFLLKQTAQLVAINAGLQDADWVVYNDIMEKWPAEK